MAQERFNPRRGIEHETDFESPAAARVYCEQYPAPKDKLIQIINAHIAEGDYGFASECVMELEVLDNAEAEMPKEER